MRREASGNRRVTHVRPVFPHTTISWGKTYKDWRTAGGRQMGGRTLGRREENRVSFQLLVTFVTWEVPVRATGRS